MSKLSNAGKLYLNEYYILNEAKRDLEQYLDSVADQVTQNLLIKGADFNTAQFSWNVWQNKSTKGRIDVEFKAKESLPFFREGKADIYVIYKDIRHTTKLKDPGTIRLSVWTPAAAKGVEQEIQQRGLRLSEENVYEERFIELNIEDSRETAEKIVELIIEKSELIFSIISQMAGGKDE